MVPYIICEIPVIQLYLKEIKKGAKFWGKKANFVEGISCHTDFFL